MKEEKLLKTLLSLGFTQLEAETYLLFEKNGLMKAIEVGRKLKVRKQRLYPVIRRLQSKGIVNATLERPARFSAVPFDKVLDFFAKAKIEEAQRVKQNKAELLSDWKSIATAERDSSPAKFTVIEGRSYIYSKIQQMMQETKSQMSFVATPPSLARAEVFGLFDAAFSHPSRSKIRFRFLAELTEQNAEAMRTLLRKKPKGGLSLEGRAPDLGLKLCPRMVIRDEEETVFFIDPRKGAFTNEQDNVCLWTNCKSLVQSFSVMFEDLWRNSVDIENRIAEIEAGKQTFEKSPYQDGKATHKKLADTLLSAEKEVIMMTSSEGLLRFWKEKIFKQKWAERNVAVKIMAPITSKNFRVARQLLPFIEVRHVPQSYLETTIVDGKHLFQFKVTSSGERTPMNAMLFRNSFYTNEPEQMGRMANTMDKIWRNARPLSASTLESIVGSYGFEPPPLSNNNWRAMQGVTIVEEKPGTATEEEVLNKIINADHKLALEGEDRLYATAGIALIHPPESFNLPYMLLRINHIGKMSGFGAEDNISVNLWLETPDGHAYVRASNIGDNPVAVARRRECDFGDTPAKNFCRLVKKDEIHIRAYGNSLFCGWTVPIPLFPKYVLPPACLMIEGYGKVKTRAFSCVNSSGYKFDIEQNYFDAFVTFMHPASKYSGPGTDGLLIRDLIITTTPPI